MPIPMQFSREETSDYYLPKEGQGAKHIFHAANKLGGKLFISACRMVPMDQFE
jgi:hypothetical protein